jgi:hypothetical protein
VGEGEGDEVIARWRSRTTRAPGFFGICHRKRIARRPSGALVSGRRMWSMSIFGGN